MNDHNEGLLWMFLLALSALIAAPISIARARLGSAETKRISLLAWSWIGAAVLFGLDSCVAALALSSPRSVGWLSYAYVAGFLTAVLLAVGPHRAGGWRKTGLCVAVLWAWSLCLPWIPWHAEKRAILDVHALMGQPLSCVKERLGKYEADVNDRGRRDEVRKGRLDELDLAPMRNGELYVGDLGLTLWVEDGVVRNGYFDYD